jgi:hypothetical protein
MYSRYDPNEYYVWRLKTKRSINQVWARVNESLRSICLYKIDRIPQLSAL